MSIRDTIEPAKPLYCGGCGMLHEAVANLTGRVFEAGSLTICIGCQAPMRHPAEGAVFFEMLEPKDLDIRAFKEWTEMKTKILRVRRKNPSGFDKLVATMRQAKRPSD